MARGAALHQRLGLGGTAATLHGLYKMLRQSAVILDTTVRDSDHKRGKILGREVVLGAMEESLKPANVPDPGSSRGALVSNSSPKSAARGKCRAVLLSQQRTVVTIQRALDHFRQVQGARTFAP